MCGRFTVALDEKAFKDYLFEHFNLTLKRSEITLPRYNVAPTQKVYGVYKSNEHYALDLFKWGLTFKRHQNVPVINTKEETIHSKHYFKDLLDKQRAIIIADGFYEWNKHSKIPHYFNHHEQKLFAFAAIYQIHDNQKHFSIITKSASSDVFNHHDRMPVMLDLEMAKQFLSIKNVTKLLKIIKEDYFDLDIYPVSKAVNSTKNDNVSLIKKTVQQSLFDV